jgi:hypothetical protein
VLHANNDKNRRWIINHKSGLLCDISRILLLIIIRCYLASMINIHNYIG